MTLMRPKSIKIYDRKHSANPLAYIDPRLSQDWDSFGAGSTIGPQQGDCVGQDVVKLMHRWFPGDLSMMLSHNSLVPTRRKDATAQTYAD